MSPIPRFGVSKLKLKHRTPHDRGSLIGVTAVEGWIVMARQHLGDRHAYMVRASTRADFAAVAAERGYSSVSRWLADVGYHAAGMEELVLGPDRKGDQDQLRLPA